MRYWSGNNLASTCDWELFDLLEDPGDQTNLYGKAGYEDIQSDLKKRLKALRQGYQVPEEDPSVSWAAMPVLLWISLVS